MGAAMELWESKLYRGDILAAGERIDLEQLKNQRILVTGASGLIGSAIVDILIGCNLTVNAGITIYAAGRSEEKLKRRFAHGVGSGLVPVKYDATRVLELDFPVDYIIHGASNASPDKYVSEPVDTLLANIFGVHNLLSYAVRAGVKKMVYISSSEVYGQLSTGEPLREENYGSVDILSVRSSYPMGKRGAETMCVSYAAQYGIGVSIARPGHIYGPTAQASDNRVSSLFARQAAAGENIVMKSAGTQLRSYCHCVDCATGILAVLTRGQSGQAYNISNRDSVITIRQMAEILARSAGVELIMELPSEAERAAFNPMDNSSLNSEKLEALGWRGQLDAETGLSRTVGVLRELA